MSGPIATSDVAPSCVRPGLYLGSAGAIPESVDATGISHVLVCAAELRCEVACAQRRHSCAATPQQQPQLRSATPQHQQGAYSCMHLTLWDEPACDVVAALRAAIPFIDAGRAAGARVRPPHRQPTLMSASAAHGHPACRPACRHACTSAFAAIEADAAPHRLSFAQAACWCAAHRACRVRQRCCAAT